MVVTAIADYIIINTRFNYVMALVTTMSDVNYVRQQVVSLIKIYYFKMNLYRLIHMPYTVAWVEDQISDRGTTPLKTVQSSLERRERSQVFLLLFYLILLLSIQPYV